MHLEIEAMDDSWLLRVDGRGVDVAGHVAEQFTSLTRRCNAVQRVLPNDALYADTLNVIRQYSPPDSLSAQLMDLTRQDDWLLAQVTFDRLHSAVVLLNASPHGWMVADGAIWSGPTHPHRPEPLIRRYIRSKAAAAPTALLDCFAYVLSNKAQI